MSWTQLISLFEKKWVFIVVFLGRYNIIRDEEKRETNPIGKHQYPKPLNDRMDRKSLKLLFVLLWLIRSNSGLSLFLSLLGPGQRSGIRILNPVLRSLSAAYPAFRPFKTSEAPYISPFICTYVQMFFCTQTYVHGFAECTCWIYKMIFQ